MPVVLDLCLSSFLGSFFQTVFEGPPPLSPPFLGASLSFSPSRSSRPCCGSLTLGGPSSPVQPFVLLPLLCLISVCQRQKEWTQSNLRASTLGGRAFTEKRRRLPSPPFSLRILLKQVRQRRMCQHPLTMMMGEASQWECNSHLILKPTHSWDFQQEGHFMAFVDNCPEYMYMFWCSSFFNYKVLPIRKLISIDICSTKKKESFLSSV